MAKKILLADDSITIQKVVRITLADGDYELITTDNGDDALAKIKEMRPDLIMADVVMPGKDGYQVCQAVKADPQLQSIPVVLLAGSFEGFDEMKGAQIGADGYIIKPFESQTLVSKVEELLARGPVAHSAPVEAPAPAAHEEEIPLTSDFDSIPAATAEADLWGDTPAAPEPPPPAEDIFSEPPSPPPPRPAPARPPVVSEPTLPGRSPVPAKAAPPPLPPPPEPAWQEPEPPPPAPAAEEYWQEQEPLAEAAPAEAWPEPEPPAEPAPAEAWSEPEAPAPAPAAEPDWLGHPEPPVYPAPEWPAGEEPVPPAEAVPEEAIPFAEEAPYAAEAAPAEAEVQLAEATAYQAEGYAVEGEAFSEAAPEEMQVLSPAEMLMEEAVPYQETPAEGEVMEAVPEPAAAGEEIQMAEAYAEPEPGLAEAAPAEAYAPEAVAYAEPEAAYAEPAPAVEYAEAEPAPAAPAQDWSRARPVVAQAAEEIATAAGSGLSKEELLTIVRDTVEKVVWDIVPQLAEALIEERIRHWEAQKA